jgi:dipeptidyl aminopeptidase/acylaminoacyl peptidase
MPLLLLHGENDSNIPASQSYELYHALQRQHKSVKMLILPKQGHALTDANIIAASIEAVNDWLNLAL